VLEKPKLLLSRIAASKLLHNATSSMFALVWLNLLSFVAIPIYIRILGVSEWGIVAACVSLQIIANFVDAGFSQIVPRWVARETGNARLLQSYLIVFQRVFAALGLMVFSILQFGADYLAHHWFVTSAIEGESLEIAIRIFAFQLLFQLINGLYVGFWFGMGMQVGVNARTCFIGTFKHGSAVVALAFVQPEPWLYCLVFATAAAIELIINSLLLNRNLKSRITLQISANPIIEKLQVNLFLKQVMLLSIGIIIGLGASQLDRIFLSKTQSVEHFGIYTIVFTLASAILQIQSPWAKANFPSLVKNIQENYLPTRDQIKLIAFGIFLFGILPCVIIYLNAEIILRTWIADINVNQIGEPVLKLLMISMAINCVYSGIYQIIIAMGRDRVVLMVNIISTIAALTVVYLVNRDLGVILGAYIWLALTTAQLICGITWLGYQIIHNSSHNRRSERLP